MVKLSLFNWRKDKGIDRVKRRITKHLVANAKEFEVLEKELDDSIKKVEAKALFEKSILFLALIKEDAEELYEMAHDEDVEEYRALYQLKSMADNLAQGIKQLENNLDITALNELKLLDKEIIVEDQHILEFLKTMRLKWMSEARDTENIFNTINPFEDERLSKKLLILNRDLFDVNNKFESLTKDIDSDLKLAVELTPKSVNDPQKYKIQLDEVIKRLKNNYKKLVDLVEEQQKEHHEIYQLDYVLMHRLKARIDKFKENVLLKAQSTGFNQLTKEDVVDKKTKPEILSVLAQFQSPGNALSSCYLPLKDFIDGLTRKLALIEGTAIR